MVNGGHVESFHVVSMEYVAYLLASARDGEGLFEKAFAGLDGFLTKPAHPALVVSGKLPAAIHGGMTKHHGLEAEDAGVIQHVLVCCAFGAAVWGMKTELCLLVNAIRVLNALVASFSLNVGVLFQVAIDFVGG